MSFAGVVGHERVVRRLARAVARNTPHHAYLFHGPSGVGRRRVALGLAMALNCEVPGARREGAACGACGSCRRILAGIDQDLWMLAPEAASEGGSGPRAIRIDTIRELQGRLAYRASEGRWRAVILDDVEQMTVQAANALLKTLEEPPKNTVLVLITSRPGQMLSTIRSRCLQIGFHRLDAQQVTDHLVRHEGLDPTEAALRAAAAGGSIGAALALSPDEVERERDLLGRLFRATRGTDAKRLEVAIEIERADRESNAAGGTLVRRVLLGMAEVLRDAVAQRACAAGARRPDCSDLVKALISGYDAEALLAGLQAVNRARDRLDRNMRPRLVLESLLLEIG